MTRKLLYAIAVAAICGAAVHAASETPQNTAPAPSAQQENESPDATAPAETQGNGPMDAMELASNPEDEASLNAGEDNEFSEAAARPKKDPCRAYGQYYAGINPKNGKILCCHKGEHIKPGTLMCVGGHHGGGGGGGIAPPGNCYSQPCPAGYYCNGQHCISTGGQWHKGCYTDTDCRPGYRCDSSSGNCYQERSAAQQDRGGNRGGCDCNSYTGTSPGNCFSHYGCAWNYESHGCSGTCD
ncbi:MAG: hypothetical protein WC421_03720 [Elusimicrobiales bacterium]